MLKVCALIALPVVLKAIRIQPTGDKAKLSATRGRLIFTVEHELCAGDSLRGPSENADYSIGLNSPKLRLGELKISS
jgi:hypothetical protein